MREGLVRWVNKAEDNKERQRRKTLVSSALYGSDTRLLNTILSKGSDDNEQN